MLSQTTQLYLGADELGNRLEISRWEVYRRVKSGELPPPDALVGKTFGWRPATVAQAVFAARGVPSNAA